MIYRSVDRLKDNYDVVIIGSGLGGLTAAQVLSKKFGYSVAIMEHHNQIGGLAAFFKRKGHIFDVSLHGFPVGMIKTCKRYWNADIASSIVQLPAIRFENPQFSFTTTFDREDFTNKLETVFNIKRCVVEDFFNTVSKMDYFNDDGMTARELFEKFFPGRNDVVRLLMEPISYANGSTLDDPAISYGIVFSNFMSKGVYTFQGGTDLLVEKMGKELCDNGVDIGLCCLVQNITVENGHATGVVVNEKQIKAKAVISNGNILRTIHSLVGDDKFSSDFADKVSSVRVNNSSCQVYMGIAEGESIEDVGDLIFTSEEPEFDAVKLKQMNTKSRTFSIYYPKTRPGTDKYAIVASTNALYEDWIGLSPDEYRHAKRKLCDDTLECLEKFIHDVRDKIDFIEAATPRTFERFTLHEEGSSFGTKFEGLDVSMNLQKEIPGLYHTGSVGIIMSGWLGAANYGVITANNVDKELRSE